MEHEDKQSLPELMQEPLDEHQISGKFSLSSQYLPSDTSLLGLLSAVDHPDWRVREAAVRHLGNTGEGDEARTVLLFALEDPAPSVRAAAAHALGNLKDGIEEEPLLKLLRDDEDADTRAAAAQSLSVLGECLSQHALTELQTIFYREGEDAVVRSSIIYALGSAGSLAPMNLLYNAMYDRQWLVREAAVLTIGEQENSADEETLLKIATDKNEHPMVVQAAYQALGGLAIHHEKQLANSQVRIELIGRSPSTEVIKPAYLVPQHVGNVTFDGIEPGFINIEKRIPVVSQALDNQWVPASLLNALLTGRVHLEAAQDYLRGLVRTEYLRALINGEQIIMNRAFLYNNAVVVRDYIEKGPDREIFKQFLSQGVIIPFLLYEHSPDEAPRFSKLPAFEAWTQVCQETHMQCIRFSWLSEEANEDEIKRFGSALHRFAQSNQVLNISRLVKDLAIPADQEVDFRCLLDDLHSWSSQFYMETGEHIRREEIYKRYITRGEPAHRLYDGSRPFAGAIKQLFDVAYSSNLAQSLSGYLLTPVDSPTSLILQDWHARAGHVKNLTTPELIRMVSEKIFEIVESGLYLRSIGMLRLQDVQAIRSTDEWRVYINSLEKLLHYPLEFASLANDVYQNYIHLAKVITRLVEAHNDVMGAMSCAEWRPDVRLIINVGGSATTVLWHLGEDKPFTDANEQKHNLPKVMGGVAPVNVRMIIGDSSSPSKLHTSIDILQGNMQAAQMQWLDLCDGLSKELRLREFSLAHTSSEKIPNLNAAVESNA